ncbi:MmcQ/YjbR family DNA-binding protein, partial [uncultured Veillonella sp.]|uniref:MmcQ/YjbR family DNA-binding protein n=1 Tax=uncultured Veillonella sp. TaxID=159268 RepID=UPI002609AEEC
IKGYQVGHDTNEPMNIVNLKCESDLIPNLIHGNGIYPAYHMNKTHWISVDIEGYEDIEKLKILVDMSYQLVGHK